MTLENNQIKNPIQQLSSDNSDDISNQLSSILDNLHELETSSYWFQIFNIYLSCDQWYKLSRFSDIYSIT